MTYAEKLKHPMWQKTRLEIMKRDDFKCLDCGASEKTLNVHHCYYESGLMPWEYPGYSLKTYCEDCHKTRQQIETLISMSICNNSTKELNLFFSDVLCSGMNLKQIGNLVLNETYK